LRDALRLLILRDYAWWMLRTPTLPEPTQRLYAEGLNALADGSYLKANRLLEQTVQQQPGFVPATLRLAETYLELDQIQRAQETLLRVNGARSRCPSREGEYCSRRSTSARTAGSPWQRSSIRAARTSSGRSSASAKTFLTFSHCSGGIIVTC